MRGAFVQGALRVLEEAGVRADVYAGASSSAVLAAQAAIGRIRRFGSEEWEAACRVLEQGGNIGDVVDQSIERVMPLVGEWLFEQGAPRLLVPACHVRSPEAARVTQGDRALELGRQLLRQVQQRDRSWVDAYLDLHVFDTKAKDASLRIRRDNLAEILYASTRMPHAWPRPASVDGRPYIDGAFLCLVPVNEAAATSVSAIVAVVTDPGPVYSDLFRERVLPESRERCDLWLIRPAMDLSEIGVDVMNGTTEGLMTAVRHGELQAETFLRSLEPVTFERRPRKDE
ncbi:MAG: hypothetical protein FJX78_09945 [Armatimonadetes bacterium]|nr:hypothetical protein [Armatimonadota bacterium]